MAAFSRSPFSIGTAIAILTLVSQAIAAITINSTLLILSRESNATSAATSILQGYGIPYQVVDLSLRGSGYPQLNSTPDAGNFGGIVAVSARDYDGGDDWKSVLSDKQWQELYKYQEAFGVRLVRLNAWPSADFGVQSSGGKVVSDLPVAVSNAKSFSTANIIE